MALNSNPINIWQSSSLELSCIKKLGAGAFGTVFEIKKQNPFTKNDCSVATKQISIELYKHVYPMEDYPVTRMKREIELLVSLSSQNCGENVVRYFTHWFEGPDVDDLESLNHSLLDDDDYSPDVPPSPKNWLFIEMELCGSTLQGWLADRPTQEDRDVGQIALILKQVLQALVHVHSLRIIHRDIKPDNIFITNIESITTVKLGDFGLGKMLQGDKSQVTTERVGSTRYQSPEMLRGDGRYSEKTDIFSTGLVYLQLLLASETITFVRDIRDVFVILQTKVQTSVMDCPDLLIFPMEVALIKKMTSYFSDTRYNAGQVLEALENPENFLEKVTLERKRDATFSCGLVPPVYDFFGREEELKIMKNFWKSSCSPSTTLMVSGMPGIGKTEIVRKFCDSLVKEGMSHCIWLDGSSQDTQEQATNKLAKSLDLPPDIGLSKLIKKIPKRPPHSPSRVTVCIDNVSKPGYDHVSSTITACTEAKVDFIIVVMTSCDKKNSEKFDHKLVLNELTPVACQQFITERLGPYMDFMSSLNQSERLVVDKIASNLNHHPVMLDLAVRHLQALISSRSRSFSSIWQVQTHMRERKLEFLNTRTEISGLSLFHTCRNVLQQFISPPLDVTFDILKVMIYCFPRKWVTLEDLSESVKPLTERLANIDSNTIFASVRHLSNLNILQIQETEKDASFGQMYVFDLYCDVVQQLLRLDEREAEFISLLIRNLIKSDSLTLMGIVNLWAYCSQSSNFNLRQTIISAYRDATITILFRTHNPEWWFKNNDYQIDWPKIAEQLKNNFGLDDPSTIAVEFHALPNWFDGTVPTLIKYIDLMKRRQKLDQKDFMILNMGDKLKHVALKLVHNPARSDLVDALVEQYLEDVRLREDSIPINNQHLDMLLIPIISWELSIENSGISEPFVHLTETLLHHYVDLKFVCPNQLLVPLRLIYHTFSILVHRYPWANRIEFQRSFPIIRTLRSLFSKESEFNIAHGFNTHYFFREMKLLSEVCDIVKSDLSFVFVNFLVDIFSHGKHPTEFFKPMLEFYEKAQTSDMAKANMEVILKDFDNLISEGIAKAGIMFSYGYQIKLEVMKTHYRLFGKDKRMVLTTTLNELGRDETLQKFLLIMRAVVLFSNLGSEIVNETMNSKVPAELISHLNHDKLTVESGDFVWLAKISQKSCHDEEYVRQLMKQTMQAELSPVILETIEKCRTTPNIFDHVILHFPDLFMSEIYFPRTEIFDFVKDLTSTRILAGETDWIAPLTSKICSKLTFLDSCPTIGAIKDICVLHLILMSFSQAAKSCAAITTAMVTFFYLNSRGDSAYLKDFCANALRFRREGLFPEETFTEVVKAFCCCILKYSKEDLANRSLSTIKKYVMEFCGDGLINDVTTETYFADLQTLCSICGERQIGPGVDKIPVNIVVSILLHTIWQGLPDETDVLMSKVVSFFLQEDDTRSILELGRLCQVGYNRFVEYRTVKVEEFQAIVEKCKNVQQ